MIQGKLVAFLQIHYPFLCKCFGKCLNLHNFPLASMYDFHKIFCIMNIVWTSRLYVRLHEFSFMTSDLVHVFQSWPRSWPTPWLGWHVHVRGSAKGVGMTPVNAKYANLGTVSYKKSAQQAPSFILRTNVELP